MKTKLCLAAALLSLAFFIASARAEQKVGDAPTLSFDSANGLGHVDLADYRGKIVVVDFWATWCGPCMHDVPEMVKIYNNDHAKGVEFIGVSLDQNKAPMLATINKMGMVWPEYFDAKMWNTPLVAQWLPAVQTSIPHTFVIGPDGKVLWAGHPEADGGLAAILDQALVEHPPTTQMSSTTAPSTAPSTQPE